MVYTVDNSIRKILLAAFCVATAAVIGVVWFAYASKTSIGFGQQCSGGYCWGYRLDQSKFVPKTRLTLWNSSGLSLSYDLPPGVVVPVNRDRWLGDGRAIYLNFRIQKTPNSQEPGDHVRIVYDFQRASMHVSSPLALWRNDDRRSADPGHNWLTDDQLDLVLIQIDPTV